VGVAPSVAPMRRGAGTCGVMPIAARSSDRLAIATCGAGGGWRRRRRSALARAAISARALIVVDGDAVGAAALLPSYGFAALGNANGLAEGNVNAGGVRHSNEGDDGDVDGHGELWHDDV